MGILASDSDLLRLSCFVGLKAVREAVVLLLLTGTRDENTRSLLAVASSESS